MPKHNNALQHAHFHKDWQNRVKTWFDQPGRKKSRRIARQEKAKRIAPRPVAGALRPAVRAQTLKYNTKIRAGRGFTLEELKAAGVSPKAALGLGISVDHRRKNKSLETYRANVQRLKTYKSQLIVFPRKAGKPKAGDSDASVLKTASQFAGEIIPIRNPKVKLTHAKPEQTKVTTYATLRRARADARLVGIRKKRAEEAAEAEK